MSFNKNTFAFQDIKEAFDQAVSAEKGIRIPCASRGSAINLRSRFNYYRKTDRAQSKGIYPPSHPMHGNSTYDRLVLRIPARDAPDANVLYIEHRSVENFHIEEIP